MDVTSQPTKLAKSEHYLNKNKNKKTCQSQGTGELR